MKYWSSQGLEKLLLSVVLLMLPVLSACAAPMAEPEKAAASRPAVSQIQSEPLPVGSAAPAFDLPATYGRQVKLSDYAGKNLLLIFYPKDNTSGCTLQLCALRDAYASFQALNTEGLASNPDTVESHETFADRQQYKFPILADMKQTMAQDYHAWNPETTRVARTVYIIDGHGIIRYAKRGLPNNEELLEAVRSLKPQ